jgi:polyhydroxyalkanoate synthesis regulator phasin
VEDMKKKEERMEKQMNEIMAENKRLTEPLQKAREQVEELRKQVRKIFETCSSFFLSSTKN